MPGRIRYFQCGYPGCHAKTAFNTHDIKQAGQNIIKCSGCSREWVATITSGCCSLNIKFVSIEKGSRRPVVFIKSFPKD